MRRYSVVFTPEAEGQLVALHQYIAEQGAPSSAERYVDSIIAHCEGFSLFPHRGTPRDDVRPGLRLTHYKRRAVIAFSVDEALFVVAIIGIFYGGQDFEVALSHEEPDVR